MIGDELGVSIVSKLDKREVGIHPYGLMKRFGGLMQLSNGIRDIDMADLFGPKLVFRHIGKTAEKAEPARLRNAPSGLFKHFAVQCREDGFSGVYAATRKLEFRGRFCLMGQ